MKLCPRQFKSCVVIVSFKPQVTENYNAFSSASESNKQNPRDRTLDLHLCFRYKHIVSLESHLSFAQAESLPYWFQGNFCGHVCFDSLVERMSFVVSL